MARHNPKAKILNSCDVILNSLVLRGITNPRDLVSHMRLNIEMCDSICIRVANIGELSKHLSDEFKSKYNHINFRELKMMRNKIDHDYDTISHKRVALMVFNNVLPLRKALLDEMNKRQP